MTQRHKNYFIYTFFVIFIFGNIFMNDQAHARTYTAEEMSANPERLNGMTVTGDRLDNVVFKDVTLKNVTFKNIRLSKFTFTNVVFDNCKFIDICFYRGELNNVLFQGGLFAKRSKDIAADELIETSRIMNVVFDATVFDNAYFTGLRQGSLFLQNIHTTQNYSGPGGIFRGKDIFVAIRKCSIKGVKIVQTSGNSKIYAKDSFFDDSGFARTSTATYVDNCSFIGASDPGDSNTLVFINSRLLAWVETEGDVYFYNNTFLVKDGPPRLQTGVQGSDKSRIYVLSDKRAVAPINFVNGNIFLRNLDWVHPVMVPWEGQEYIKRVDLQNVAIRDGGLWEKLHLLSGQWENVQIYPAIDIADAKIENVEGYNVTFPEGVPWIGTPASNTSIRMRNKPFDWPEIKVPTLKDLGMEWEWPVITGKPLP